MAKEKEKGSKVAAPGPKEGKNHLNDLESSTEIVKHQLQAADSIGSLFGEDWPGPKTYISVLQTLVIATKRWRKGPDGRPSKVGYGKAKNFYIEEWEVAGITDFHELLKDLNGQPDKLIIRGFLAPGKSPDEKTTRTKNDFVEKRGQPFLLLDIDGVPCAIDPVTQPAEAIEYLITNYLPPEVHDVSMVWQWSSSTGMGPTGIVSAHFWVWLDRPMTFAQLRAWYNRHPWFKPRGEHERHLDRSLFRLVQPHYTAAPIFEDGLTDPVNQRLGLRKGARECATLVIPEENEDGVRYSTLDEDDPFAIARGFEQRLALLGDGDGCHGFCEPIVAAIASYVGTEGTKTNREALKSRVRDAIYAAPNLKRSRETIEDYASDAYLDRTIESAIDRYGKEADERIAARGVDKTFDVIPPASPEEERWEELKESVKTTQEGARERRVHLPWVRCIPGELESAVDAAEEALIRRGDGCPVYKNASRIVEVGDAPLQIRRGEEITAPQIKPVGVDRMVSLFEESAQFIIPNGKRANCPDAIAKRYLARIKWKAPHLTGIATAPILREDGTVHVTEGYDSYTGLLLIPRNFDLRKVSLRDRPNCRTAADDWDSLQNELFDGFPFVNDTDKAVMLSGLLTPHVMGFVPHAPLHGYWSTVAGTGKGKLVDTAAVIYLGHPCAAIQYCKSPTEWEKRLDSVLLAGRRMVMIDNVDRGLHVGGPVLCTTLTQNEKEIRVLGFSKIVTADTTGLFIAATGNLLSFEGDMDRRTVLCRLDSGHEAPEQRPFDFDPVARAMQNRERYWSMVINMLRAFILDGKPEKVKALGSFESWSEIIGGTIAYLGLPNPADSQAIVKAANPERDVLLGLLGALVNHPQIGPDKEFYLRQIIEYATSGSDFDPQTREAVEAATGLPIHDKKTADALGKYVRRFQRAPAVIDDDQYQLVQAKVDRNGVAKWWIAKTKPGQRPEE
jgi:putative DNA primase/helicase